MNRALGGFNELAHVLLWRAFRRGGFDHPPYPYEPETWSAGSIGIASDAARVAATAKTRRASRDVELHLAVVRLAEVYACATGSRATFWREDEADDDVRNLAASPCGRMVRAFFAAVDPELSRSAPSNALKLVLMKRPAD